MLSLEEVVLIIIDMQGNLANSMFEKELLFNNLGKLIKGCKVLKIPMIVTEQNPGKLGGTIQEINELLPESERISKIWFSCCDNYNFMRTIEGLKRKKVLLSGIECHICVYQTARDLLRLGFQVYVVADAVSSISEKNRSIGLDRMTSEGVIKSSTEMALFEILRVAEGEKFKKIINIVK